MHCFHFTFFFSRAIRWTEMIAFTIVSSSTNICSSSGTLLWTRKVLCGSFFYAPYIDFYSFIVAVVLVFHKPQRITPHPPCVLQVTRCSAVPQAWTAMTWPRARSCPHAPWRLTAWRTDRSSPRCCTSTRTTLPASTPARPLPPARRRECSLDISRLRCVCLAQFRLQSRVQ